MKFDPILIVTGEPNSIFFEILFKTFNKIRIKKPIILITSHDLLKKQMKILNYKKKVRVLEFKKIKKYKLNNRSINLININYEQKKVFSNISKKSNQFINETFNLAFKLIKKEKITKLINGPVSKKHFLNKKYLGITEYISEYFSKKKTCMLIFNNKLSVCPITTHLPIKLVAKRINKKIISEKIFLINEFYEKKFSFKPKIAVLGLNPHCESILKFNEDEKIIRPVIEKMSSNGYKVSGPHSADTIFLKNNRKNIESAE